MTDEEKLLKIHPLPWRIGAKNESVSRIYDAKGILVGSVALNFENGLDKLNIHPNTLSNILLYLDKVQKPSKSKFSRQITLNLGKYFYFKDKKPMRDNKTIQEWYKNWQKHNCKN